MNPVDMPRGPIRIWWEDLEVGQVRDLGSLSPTREDILAFAGQFDPQPFHLDDEAARGSVFGALCASGWHTCAMAMRLMVTNFLHETSSLGSPGLESLKWLKPVFPGDVLRLQHTITEKRPMNSRPDVGLVRTVWEMFNQKGEKVLHMEGYGMFRLKEPPRSAAPQ
ncbi:MaoC family dehydratase [uncultured Hydrogenophaga sp.]|uniref:MaoC family dehydratase n=1 Tax=uncultured Hydrogenophaga sp. TaxID=199683 RepID=UPI00266035D6|nr:MaoC family dehydratase [uncultured Hydrogenophaga sp.]